MLKGIPAVLSPELLKILMEMGHREIGQKHEKNGLREMAVQKTEFYPRGAKCYACVATGEKALYANVIIKKGVV